MEVIIDSNIRIREPSVWVERWCKSNLVFANPEYAAKVRLGLWTGRTPQTLSLFERQGDWLVLPFGVLGQIWPLIKDPIIPMFEEPTEVDYGGEDIPLYDYQKEAVRAMMDSRYGILQSAAGSGKTQMGLAIVKEYKRPALWITHTADLLRQSKERAERYMDSKVIGTITEGKVNIGKGITFATVQTLAKLDLSRYRNLWDVIIVDECHHVSGSPTTVTRFYKVLNSLCARHKYGLSATVHRSDGLIGATHAMLGEVMWRVPDEAIADKIMRVGIKPVGTGIPLSEECLRPDGTLDYIGLVTYLSQSAERNALIVSNIIAERDHPCLILSDRLEHLHTLLEALPLEMRIRAGLINGKMVSKKGRAEREFILKEMRDGRLQYLFATYALAKEGLDIPRLERLFMATPVKDEAVVIQSIGRIARTCDGKQFPIAYDYVDSIRYCQRAYNERVRHYKKIGATAV